MIYIVIALLLLSLFSSKSSGQKQRHRRKNRPWYDISYEDMILYDFMDDD